MQENLYFSVEILNFCFDNSEYLSEAGDTLHFRIYFPPNVGDKQLVAAVLSEKSIKN